MGIRTKIKREISILSILLRENGFSTVIRHVFGSHLQIGVGKSDILVVHGHSVLLRRGSHDLKVALSTLGGEFDVLKSHMPQDFSGLILDAGGYIGTAALALSDMFPNAIIVSIEPDSSNFKLAQKNTSSVGNITVLHAALVASDGPSEITLYDRGTGDWGFTIIKNPADRTATKMEQVKTITIEAVLKRFNFESVSIVKLDIEGAELQLFQSPSWLDSVEILIVELHERIVPGCEAAFHAATQGRNTKPTDGEKYISVRAKS